MTWFCDPHHLRTLEVVVRNRSFQAAADEIGYTQSAVSQQIAELERRIGARVVTRRPVQATAAGEVLLAASSEIDAALSRAALELAALSEGSMGQIRVGSFISAAATIVPPALALLRFAHPGLHIVLDELEAHETYSLLARGALDLAITFDYDHTPEPVPPGIVRVHLKDDPIMVALPSGHPLAANKAVDLSAVAPDAWIVTEVDALTLTPDGAPASPQQPPRLDFQGQDFRTALNLVASGLGVALLPQLLLKDPPAGVVARAMVKRQRIVRRIFACRLETTRVPEPISKLEGYLRQAAANN